jgi:hypothetical protein
VINLAPGNFNLTRSSNKDSCHRVDKPGTGAVGQTTTSAIQTAQSAAQLTEIAGELTASVTTLRL